MVSVKVGIDGYTSRCFRHQEHTRHYDKFHNTPNTKDGLMIESIKKTYWGIDQAAVSFSYSFDLKKKGGKR